MNLQPRQFFADIAAVGQDRGFLRQPLRIDLRAFEQFLQALRQAASGKPPSRPRESAPSAPRPPRRARYGRAFPRRSPRLRARETRSVRRARLRAPPAAPFRLRPAVPALRPLRRTFPACRSAAFRSGSRIQTVRVAPPRETPSDTHRAGADSAPERAVRRGRAAAKPAPRRARASRRLFTIARIGVLERIGRRRRVHLHVQPAMIQALDADHQFAVAQRPADAGESGHAAQRRDLPCQDSPRVHVRFQEL